MHELNTQDRERAVLVGVARSGERWLAEDHLEELALLTDTAGADVIEMTIQEKNRIDPAYFVGKGKAKDLAERVTELQANLLIFDDDLSPAQVRNLEKLTGLKVLDRSGLILDIFARRAKTKEARTQVELAQLNYLLPRLTRQWTHLSRQVGGIGTRGPGETQLEVDRRLIRKRIGLLTKALDRIKSQRHVRRQGRQDSFKVALVGYTNAGKSTLLNTLTQSDVFVEDRLFATLDATIRRLKVDNQKDILVIDTVGFIRKLPHNLVASFMSTLEEARLADAFLHVVDVTHPHLFEHISVVKDVLNDLDILDKPTVFVFNKIDKLKQKAIVDRLKQEFSPAVFVSAVRGFFLQDLIAEILKLMTHSVKELVITMPARHSEIIARLHSLSDVKESVYEEDRVRLVLTTPNENVELIKRLLEKKLPGEFEWTSANGGEARIGKAKNDE